MLLINIHHYIMGLAGSAREGGRGTRAAAAAAASGGSRGRIPGPGLRQGWGGGFLSGDQKRGGERRGRSRMAQRGRVGGTASRREEVWGRGGVQVNACLLLLACSGGAGALETLECGPEGTQRALERGRCCHRLLVLGNVVRRLG